VKVAVQVMSKDLFDYLVREKIADGPLIAKWRKPGYEILCSMLAIQKVNPASMLIDRMAPCAALYCHDLRCPPPQESS